MKTSSSFYEHEICASGRESACDESDSLLMQKMHKNDLTVTHFDFRSLQVIHLRLLFEDRLNVKRIQTFMSDLLICRMIAYASHVM